MTDIAALAPVISFAALALGCVVAIRLMLRDMATTYRDLGGDHFGRALPVRVHRQSARRANIVALPLPLPLGQPAGDVSRSPNVRLPAAA